MGKNRLDKKILDKYHKDKNYLDKYTSALLLFSPGIGIELNLNYDR